MLTGETPSWCRGCTLCCELPDISELEKAPYAKCKCLNQKQCGVYERRPDVCKTFECRYVMARNGNFPERHQIPHPNDCGAYFFELEGLRRFAVFVDPKRPEEWKKSGIVQYLEHFIARGFQVSVVDRGYTFTVAHRWDQYLADDWVEAARSQGRPLDIPSFRNE